MHIHRNVAWTPARGCLFCFHTGFTAYYFGTKLRGCGMKLELFTPLVTFRWTWGTK